MTGMADALRRFARTGARRLFVALFLVPVTACGEGEDGTGPEDVAGFTFVVSGDVARSVEGTSAVTGETPNGSGGETFWVVSLVAGAGSETEGVSFLRNGERPGPGEHSLVALTVPSALPAGAIGATVVLAPSESEPGFLGAATSGTLTITRSLAGEVRGDFELEADGNLFPSGGPAESGVITLAGEFTAVPGSVSLP